MQGLTSNVNQAPNTRQSTIDVPVRILVPSESVGAIIGKGGQTIRQLTQQTRAKVDVYRGDPMAPTTALQEKVITIRGQPENCINACREILKVMKADAESKGKPSDTPLKVLAHNDYIGRIIGKQGNIINTIKKETETTVTVSSINDMSMNVERVITVKGELENMIKALEIIHSKVKSAFENDTKTYGAQAIMMGGIPPIPLAPPSFAASSAAAAAAAAAAFNAPSSAARFAAAAAAVAAAQQQQQQHHQSATGSGIQQQQQQQPPQNSSTNQQQQQSQNQQQPGQSTGIQTNQNGSGGGPGGVQQVAQQPPSNSYPNYYPPMHYHPAHHMGPQMAPYSGQNPLIPLQQQQQAAAAAAAAAASLGGHPGQLNHNVNAQNMVGSVGTGGGDFMSQGPEPETVYLYIPNVAVGAIIGTKGSFIKNIIKLSGASVKITPLTPEESKTAAERQVVIVGTPDSQWKAQYYIYEKIRQERFATDENVKLRAELQVPSHIVGRIIGKAGKNVRELQRTTGATIKLPEDIALNQQQLNQQESNSLQQPQQDDENEDENTANNTSVNSNSNQLSPTSTSAPATPLNQQQTTEQQTPTTPTAASTTPVIENGTSSSSAENNISSNEQDNTTTNNNKSETQPGSPNATTNSTTNANSNNNNNNNSVVVVRIFGTFQASQLAQRRIQSLVMQSLRGYSTNDAMMLNQRTLSNITNHHSFQMPLFMNNFHPHQLQQQQPLHHQQQQQHHHHHSQQQQQQQQQHQHQQRNDYSIQHQPRLNGGNGIYNQNNTNNNNNNNRRNNRHQQIQKTNPNEQVNKLETNGSQQTNQQAITTNGNANMSSNEQLNNIPPQQQQTA